MHVNDLADYVSESGEIAANDASKLLNNKRDLKPVKFDSHFGYVVPSFIDFHKSTEKMTFYFRARDEYKDKTLLIKQNNIMNKEKVNIILKIIIRILRVFVKKDKK